MDKIQKILDKLTKKQRAVILELWRKIINNDIANLKPKKLTGFRNYYRIRSGKLRLVYKIEDGQNILVNIDYRKDIYKNF
jgi:mRNA-degrading endonuclease RelE of RelBE toxin-antitoxin system